MTTTSFADPPCPLRPGEPCRLCQLGATGPRDCGLAYLVMTDDELRAGLQESIDRWRSRSAEESRAQIATPVPGRVDAGTEHPAGQRPAAAGREAARPYRRGPTAVPVAAPPAAPLRVAHLLSPEEKLA